MEKGDGAYKVNNTFMIDWVSQECIMVSMINEKQIHTPFLHSSKSSRQKKFGKTEKQSKKLIKIKQL